ncbi:MAG TPA: hypothetical protein DHW64_07270 [Chitinophagaceae bacterium]|nr:hypothetical protein [Chitinophagaceae bacterium]
MINLFGQRAGYTRDGAQAAMKYTDVLFKDPFLFNKGRLNVQGDKAQVKSAVLEALEESNKVIKEYEEKIEAFIKSKPTAIIVKSAYKDVTDQVRYLPAVIEKAEDGFKNWRSLSAVSFMQDLYLYKAFIVSAMKVYPEALSLEEKLEEVKAAIEKYGSIDAYMVKMEKNQVEYVKNLQMKKAVFGDPTLEASVKKQYEAIWESEKLVVTKVHITSLWILEKNALDIPLHKEVEVNIAIKKTDRTCAIASGYVRSTYEGGGKYSAPLLIMPTHPITLDCANLNK